MGTAGAPAAVSGLIERAATAASRLDGQADMVVMAVHADMQLAAMADAEQLVAFQASPFGWRCGLARFRREDLIGVGQVQLGHRIAPLFREPSKCQHESEFVSRPDRS